MQAEQSLARRYINPRIATYGTLFVALILLGIWIFSAYDDVILSWMQENQQWLTAYNDAHPVWSAVAYTLVFALVLGLYIPGGVVLMLLVGAVFPLWQANLIANIGNLLGATGGFLISRYLLHDEVQSCYGEKLCPINEGIRQHGWLYLLVLRIAPVLPSPMVNLSMGLTPMRLYTYVWATLLGRIPMTALYVNLGQELGEIERLSDLLSMEVLGSLLLVGLLMVAGHYAIHRCDD